MTNFEQGIVAVGVTVAIIIVASAIADHIRDADAIELETSYGRLRSKQNRYLLD